MAGLIIFVIVLGFAVIASAVLGILAFARVLDLERALRRAQAQIELLEDSVHELTNARAEAAHPPVVAEPASTPAPSNIVEFAPPRAEPIPLKVAAAPTPLREPRQEQRQERGPWLANIERRLAANWLVWIGGLLIAIGIVSLLNYAISEGFFNPPRQVAAAYLLGGALIAAGEWVRRNPPAAALSQTWLARAPAVLAGAGLFALFAATYAGYANFKILPGSTAFVLMVASSIGAVLAALRFGKWIAVLGLSGAYLAPGLVHFDSPSPLALFGYLIGVTFAVLAVIRLKQWRGFVWLAAAGALLWGYAWIVSADSVNAMREAAIYMLILAGIGMWFAWDDAYPSLTFTSWWSVRASWTESVSAAHVIAAVSGLIMLGMLVLGGHEPFILLTIAVLFLMMCFATLFEREAFALAPHGAAAIAIAALALWPMSSYGLPVNQPQLRMFGALFAFFFTAGGWVMMAFSREKGPGAALAAIGGLAVLLVLRGRAGPMMAPFEWGLMALALMAVNLFALNRIARIYGFDNAPGPSASFALGAAGGAILALLFALDGRGLWQGAALALLVPVIALLDLRFRLPALRAAILVATALVALRLGPGLLMLREAIGETPILNAILPVYGTAAAALWGAGMIYRRNGVRADAPTLQVLEATALALLAFGLSLEIRHLAQGGDLSAEGFTLAEIGGDAIAWIGLALALAARFGAKPRPIPFAAESILLVIALWVLLVGALWQLNPAWSPIPVPGAPIFNLLLAVYGIPAALLAAYAVLRRRLGNVERATVAGMAACVLAFANVSLEVRRLFHGPNMSVGDIGPFETWAYSLAWISFAGALLFIGLWRKRPSLRYASLAVLLMTIAKISLLDLELAGLLRVASFVGAGLCAIGVGLIYQRYVFAASNPTASPPAAS